MFPVDDPKDICACCYKQARWMEPRFAYYVCDDHKNVSPVDIADWADRKKQEIDDGN